MKTQEVSRLALIAAGILTGWASGASAWQARIPNGLASAVVTDSAENVVAAGYVSNQFTVIKFSGANGTELWRQSLVSPLGGASNAIALTPGEDVVAAGVTIAADGTRAFTVVKLSGADGSQLWRRDIVGSAPGPLPNFNSANAVTVDGFGDVVAAGNTTDPIFYWNYTVMKFSGADGTELWRELIHGSSDTRGYSDEAVAAAVGYGNGASAGIVDTATDAVSKFTVVSTSVPAQVTFVEGTDQAFGRPTNLANAVTLDQLGNIVAVGMLGNIGTGQDFAVISISGEDGSPLWRTVIDGGANGRDEALAIAAQNCCVVAGYLTSISGDRNFTVINLGEGDGTEVWRQVIDTGTGRANAVAAFLDGTGDFVAGGTLTAIRLAGADGSELWRAAIVGNTTSAVAVDGAGDVVAAGWIVNDFAVIKLNGADGTAFIPR
jgi:hypothetical protein